MVNARVFRLRQYGEPNGLGHVYNAFAEMCSSRRCRDRGRQLTKAATSLRPHIVRVMAARQERILTTEEIYGLVACLGVDGFNPSAKRDRNLVNRELSDLAGRTTQGHSRTSPHLIIRVSRGRYLYREPDQPMDVALLQEYLEVWPESHWPGFALLQVDVLQSYTA